MFDELLVGHGRILVTGLAPEEERIQFVLKVSVQVSTLVTFLADGADNDKAPFTVAGDQVLSRWLDQGVVR